MAQIKKVISPYSNIVRTQGVLNANDDSENRAEINNIDYSSNVKYICKAYGKKCKRKLNRLKNGTPFRMSHFKRSFDNTSRSVWLLWRRML